MVKPYKEGNKKGYPTHMQGFHLACEVKYIELFSRHKFISRVLKLYAPAKVAGDFILY
jgi:hypothetical protein|tara:strand:- start:5662 stop:5835 length:174 start_codon:yes stop_codon:yes gene_type:complete